MQLILVFQAVSSYCFSFDGDEQKKNRPNFLQILTDDQGWGDLASCGHVFMLTPNIDLLASGF